LVKNKTVRLKVNCVIFKINVLLVEEKYLKAVLLLLMLATAMCAVVMWTSNHSDVSCVYLCFRCCLMETLIIQEKE